MNIFQRKPARPWRECLITTNVKIEQHNEAKKLWDLFVTITAISHKCRVNQVVSCLQKKLQTHNNSAPKILKPQSPSLTTTIGWIKPAKLKSKVNYVVQLKSHTSHRILGLWRSHWRLCLGQYRTNTIRKVYEQSLRAKHTGKVSTKSNWPP